MNRLTIYLDLDRTLYKTTTAGVAIWRTIGELYPTIDATAEHDRQRDFYVHTDGAYTYDFSAHLVAAGLEPVIVYAQLQDSHLADGQFEYDGVAKLLRWARSVADVKVLTYGVDDYQRFKASLCPSLQDIEVITTLRSKGEYLQGVGAAWLVDDKPLGEELPATVQFIQVCLEGQQEMPRPWPVVRSLSEALRILQEAQADAPRCG